MNQNCLRCGDNYWHSGKLTVGTRLMSTYLSLDVAPLFSVLNTDIPVRCKLCMNCGFIELLGDVGRAREVAKE